MKHSSRHFVEQCLYLLALHLCNSAGQVLRHGTILCPAHLPSWFYDWSNCRQQNFATKFGHTICDFRLPSPCKWDLRSSAMLCRGDQYLFTDVSGQPIWYHFQGWTWPKIYPWK